MLGIPLGFISSTIQNSWAIVAPPKAITVVIQEVLRFWSILTKLSPIIRCDVPSGGCCRFTTGLQIDRLKQARGFVSGTPVKLFFIWLLFCTSITRDTFFIGISRIFLSGTLELFVGNVLSLTPVLVIVSWESCTVTVSFIVPKGAVIPETGAFLLATTRPTVSINFLTVCSKSGSPRVSLGSGIVTLPVVDGDRNSLLLSMLRVYCSRYMADWDRYLPQVMGAYNIPPPELVHI